MNKYARRYEYIVKVLSKELSNAEMLGILSTATRVTGKARQSAVRLNTVKHSDQLEQCDRTKHSDSKRQTKCNTGDQIKHSDHTNTEDKEPAQAQK